jgi:photosystem I reaction center subunit PsaK
MFAPLLIQPLAMAPATITWSPKVALVMILCNVIAIAIGKATIQQPNVGLQPRPSGRHGRHPGPGLPRGGLNQAAKRWLFPRATGQRGTALKNA